MAITLFKVYESKIWRKCICSSVDEIMSRFLLLTNSIFLFSEDATPRNDSIRLDPGSLVTSSGTFYVAIGCACVMIVVVIAVTSVVYVKSKKARTQESLQ
jgi:hypothetical protein